MSLDSAVQTLLTRLETVTKRLEQVEGQIAAGASGAPAAGGAPAAATGGADSGSGESPAVAAYQGLIDEFIQPYVKASQEIGGDVAEQAKIVLDAVTAQKAFLQLASECKKPSMEALQPLLGPTSTAMAAAGEIREKNRASKNFNNLSAISEGIQALGWVVVDKTPGPFVNEARGSSEFYSNKLLMAHKNSDKPEDILQVDWVKGWNGFLKELFTYIKAHHTTGVAWNPRGKDAPASAPAAAPPAPKQETPKGPTPGAAPAAAKPKGGLFAEINAVGAGNKPKLNKVTKDMKTKNQEGKSSVVKAAPVKARAQSKPTKPPRLELAGNKWEVEWQFDNKEIVIEDTQPKHVVYLYKCERSVVQIKGKINNITLDACTRVSLVFDTAIAAVELVNCKSIEVQCINTCPTYTVDSTSGFLLYLGKDGLATEITQSKSSEINIMIPGEDEHQIELNVPDQFKSTIVDNKVKTEEVVHV